MEETNRLIEKKVRRLLSSEEGYQIPGKVVMGFPALREALSHFRYEVTELIELINEKTRIDIELLANGKAEVYLPKEVFDDE